MANKYADQVQLFLEKVTKALNCDHAVPAVHPDGHIGLIYSDGPVPKEVKFLHFPLISEFGADLPRWDFSAINRPIVLGSPSAGIYVADDSCENPWLAATAHGYAAFWVRRNTSIANTTMTIGASLEMAKLKVLKNGRIQKFAGSVHGKGYVLDNQIICGDYQVLPRAALSSKNIVGVVYCHQTVYNLNAGVHEREGNLRGAYLDFAPDGKPTLISNRTAGSVSDAVDGGYSAGSTTYLPSANAIKCYDEVAKPTYASVGGCLLPSCVFGPRGMFLVAYGQRGTGSGTGGIVMRMYLGVRKGSMLDAVQIWSDNSSNGATATWIAMRPMLAFRDTNKYALPIASSNYPPVILTYADVEPTAAGVGDSSGVVAKTITWPINGGVTPTIAALALGTNTNMDATADNRQFPFPIDCPWVSAVAIEENVGPDANGFGRKFTIAHLDGTFEVMTLPITAFPHRLNWVAAQLPDGKRIVVASFDGHEGDGVENAELFLTAWKF